MEVPSNFHPITTHNYERSTLLRESNNYNFSRDLTMGERFLRVLAIIATVVGSIFPCIGTPFLLGEVRDQIYNWCEEVSTGKAVNTSQSFQEGIALALKDKISKSWPDKVSSTMGCLKINLDHREINHKFIFRNSDASPWIKAYLPFVINRILIESFKDALLNTTSSSNITLDYVLLSKTLDNQFIGIEGQSSFHNGAIGTISPVDVYNVPTSLKNIGFDTQEVIINDEFA
ncbi:MAG: hypothetical protein H0T62_04725 [Parachlamydiaceae bacterium]|nr:hypothetical protein [Parachlamydiaceae bacterium]